MINLEIALKNLLGRFLILELAILFLPALTYALNRYNIDPNSITISGVSSGAFMAVQMEVAFSATLSGAASIAGGTYWCAHGDPQLAQIRCMQSPEQIIADEQVRYAQEVEAQGKIDPLVNLRRHRVYLFASPIDRVIVPLNTSKLKDFLTTFLSPAQVQVEQGLRSAHGFPTLNYGGLCDQGGLPWLLNCGFNTAEKILQTFYGELQPARDAIEQNLLTFSQRQFADRTIGFWDSGWLYVPQSCALGGRCRLHVALHGCQMNPEYIQDQFVRHSGFNEIAESNHLIVLYPQAAKLTPQNPFACWDWFGFTGADYANKKGPQMAALKAMIEQIAGGTQDQRATKRNGSARAQQLQR